METKLIGIVTGGAGGEIYAAAREGIDTYITGEAPHWAAVAAEELGINLFLGGHYATETFGVKALAAELSGQFEVPWEFLDHPTGIVKVFFVRYFDVHDARVFLLLLRLRLVLFCCLFIRLRELRQTIDALTERIAALERKLQGSEPPAAPEKTAIPPSPLVATPRRDSPTRVPDEQKLVPPAASIPPPLPPPLPPAPPPATPFNWEAFMGVKLFAWLGGLALFLGVVFMVKYSFENNLITPLGRIVIGGTVGLALVASGWWLARGRYRVTAQSLCATGIVILYADLFAAHSFYALISLTTAFFAMSAVTLFSFLLAVNLSAQVIVILGLLGGFLTPVLLRSGADNAPALFLYIALLDLGWRRSPCANTGIIWFCSRPSGRP